MDTAHLSRSKPQILKERQMQTSQETRARSHQLGGGLDGEAEVLCHARLEPHLQTARAAMLTSAAGSELQVCERESLVRACVRACLGMSLCLCVCVPCLSVCAIARRQDGDPARSSTAHAPRKK
eukprot:2052185-Rhodomonas_salina.1